MKPIFLFALLSLCFNQLFAQNVNLKREFDFAGKQMTYMLSQILKAEAGPAQQLPRTFENNKLKLVASHDWTSGFFPGILWFLYEYTKDEKWMNEARKYTEKLKSEQFNTGTHDLGFIMFCSYGNAYRLTRNPDDKNIIIQSTRSLASRFSSKTGVIRSWDHHSDLWKNPVIIDNMMNLELLFEATKLSGDSSFYRIAVSHADHTLKNHFRPDFSSYHVVDYDPETGEVIRKMTHQGYANESAWARGQAWALYGYTMCYRYTHNRKYLEQAKHVADFIFNNPNLPKDLIPYSDYNDPAIPKTSRDASAAAVTASALYELDSFDKTGGYRNKADKIVGSLSAFYHSRAQQNAGFLLLHSTGNRPAKSEIDAPLIYADYYYLEALLRKGR